jgi:hypothetical protein
MTDATDARDLRLADVREERTGREDAAPSDRANQSRTAAMPGTGDTAASGERYPYLMGRSAMLGFVLLAGIAMWWFLRARHEGETWDLGAVYEGGQAAWATGHPEQLASWIASPLVGFVMAIVSLVSTQEEATFANDLLNLIVVLVAVTIVLRRLRGVLSPVWWWVSAFALVSFGPMMSAVWWHQFDVFALVGAVAGFDLLRRGRSGQGAAVIGISIAFKPLAILLPFVLLARRETRRAGAAVLGWAIGLNVAAQCFMAWRAHSLSPLNLFKVLGDFNTASGPTTYRACDVENFAPSSVLCQLVGKNHWSLQHVVVLVGVALLAVWVIDALRHQRPLSWEVFAFTCVLSIMASPVSWSHYQVMLAPLFLLLLVRFTKEGASIGTWSGLAVAFMLASLSWRPNGTLVGALRGVLTGASEDQAAWSAIMDVAQVAQYILLFTGIMWYLRRRAHGPTETGAPALPEAPSLRPAYAANPGAMANSHTQQSRTAEPRSPLKLRNRPKLGRRPDPQSQDEPPKPDYDGRLQGVGNGHALGWCWQPGAPRERTQIAIAIDGEIVAEGVADIARPDLPECGDGAHGFLIALPDALKAPGRHRVLALAGPEKIPITVTSSFWHKADSDNGWSDVVFEPGEPPPHSASIAIVPKPPLPAELQAVVSEGWLFDAREFTDSAPPSSTDLDAIVSALTSTAKTCSLAGLNYIPVIVPAKRHATSPTPPLDRTWAAEVQARLCDVDELELIDLLPILLDAARHGPLYHRTDADWNDRGAFFVARALLEQARKWDQSLHAPTLADLHLRAVEGYRGALSDVPKLELLGNELVLCEPDVETERGVVVDASRLHALRMPVETHLAEAGSTHLRVYATTDWREDARLAIVGDSAALSLVVWLAEQTRRTTFFWSDALPLNQLELELPPVVFHLIREADLLAIPASDTALVEPSALLTHTDRSSAPSPERIAAPSPGRTTAPSPERIAAPSPERTAAPSPERTAAPSPERTAAPSPGRIAAAPPSPSSPAGSAAQPLAHTTAMGRVGGKALALATAARATLRANAWTIALVALITVLSWPFVLVKGAAGLDNSWVVGLNLAVAHGLAFGRQVIFTYGPLGFTLNPAAVTPEIFRVGEILGGGIQLALVAVLFVNLRHRMGWVAASLMTLIAASLVGWIEAEPFTAITFGLVVLTLTTPAPRIELATRRLAICGGALAAFALLVKLNDGVAASAIVAIGLLGGPRRGRDLALGAASLLATLVALWLLLGEPLGALPDYLRNSYEVVSGYVEAMGHNELGSAGQWQVLAVLGSAVALSVGAWSALSTARLRQRWALVGAVMLAHYFVAREMFVRYDYGHVAFIALLFAVALLIPWRRDQRTAGLAIAAMLAVASFAVLQDPVDEVIDPLAHAHRLVNQVEDVLSPYALIAEGQTSVRSDDKVPPSIVGALIGHCVNSEPAEIAVIWAHPHWRWCPLPVFQTYTAYTPRLDRINAAAYADARHGPDRVLRQVTETIDGRNPIWESPLAMLSLLCHFTEVEHGGEWEELARVPDRCAAPRTIAVLHSWMGHTIALPSAPAGTVLVAAIDGMQVAGRERLETLLTRARVREVAVNGKWFRVPPATADDGLILDVPSSADYAAPFNLNMAARTLEASVADHSSGAITVRLLAVPIA